jgi:hypothetical protein
VGRHPKDASLCIAVTHSIADEHFLDDRRTSTLDLGENFHSAVQERKMGAYTPKFSLF